MSFQGPALRRSRITPLERTRPAHEEGIGSIVSDTNSRNIVGARTISQKSLASIR